MPFSEKLVAAELVRRYKRFLADVVLPDGQVIVAHCPNPGSMLGVCQAGSTVLLRPAKAGRKLSYTWVLTGVDRQFVNVDTLLANKIVFQALAGNHLPPFAQYDLIEKEKSFQDSRFDFLLRDKQERQPPCYVEVKSTTLCEEGIAMFPDAVTERGRKHLSGLARAVAEGFRAVQFFCIARADVKEFRPADHIDPAYSQALSEAQAKGVEVMAFATEISYTGGCATFQLGPQVPVILPCRTG
jgi:sugar fermentation stimulation protein A